MIFVVASYTHKIDYEKFTNTKYVCWRRVGICPSICLSVRLKVRKFSVGVNQKCSCLSNLHTPVVPQTIQVQVRVVKKSGKYGSSFTLH